MQNYKVLKNIEKLKYNKLDNKNLDLRRINSNKLHHPSRTFCKSRYYYILERNSKIKNKQILIKKDK